MPMPHPGRKLRKREIVLAVAAGGLAAAGAGALMSGDDFDPPMPIAVTAAPQTYDVGPFDEISTVGPHDVVVTLGDKHSVRSDGPPEALGQIEVVVEDGTLVIRPKDESARGFSWRRLSGATYYVTVPQLQAASLAGSGSIRIDRIESPSFEGSIAGSGELSIDTMQVDEADFRIGGSGHIVAAGTARETGVTIGGSGEVQAGGLRSQTASVSIGGSGDVALNVEEAARISIAGSGDVEISGPATCSVTKMGSGDVNCDRVAD